MPDRRSWIRGIPMAWRLLVARTVAPRRRRRCAQGLREAYGATVAVDDVSFDMPGSVHALLGEAGAGKSTIVKLLSGLVGPRRGPAGVRQPGRAALAAAHALGIQPRSRRWCRT